MWIREPNSTTEENQQTALNTTFIITKTLGPSSIEILKPGENSRPENKKTVKYRVRIGETHSCTCKTSKYPPNKSLCIHVCWTLLKYLKLTVLDARSWQTGLPFRDIEALLSEKDAKPEPKSNHAEESTNEATNQNSSEGRDITIDDVCPICQETLLSAQKPVCHCNSCLQNVHIHCMKIWCDHQPQVSAGEDYLNCPMCRCSFSSTQDFRKLVHQDAVFSRTYSNNKNKQVSKRSKHDQTCENCDITPITGRLYNCLNCSELYLCAACFTNGCHSQDGDDFRFKTSKTSQFKTARKRFKKKEMPQIDENTTDRELLLQLDEPDLQKAFDIPAGTTDGLPAHIVNLIPSSRLRKNTHKLITGKSQCLLCLRKYQVEDYVRKLACGHFFHRQCVDGFLLEDYQTCPVCGNEAVRQLKKITDSTPKPQNNIFSSNQSSSSPQSQNKGAGDSLAGLSLFGVNVSKNVLESFSSSRLPPLRVPRRLGGKQVNRTIPSRNANNANLLAESFVGLNITPILREDAN